jgi:hypothetical protein
MLRLFVVTGSFAIVMGGAALAQTVTPLSPTVRSTFQSLQPGGANPNEVRVQMHTTFFVAAPTDGGDASVKAQEKARQTLYEMAGKECEVLRKALAAECRLDSINVSVNVQRTYNSTQTEGFNVGGNFGYRITLK